MRWKTHNHLGSDQEIEYRAEYIISGLDMTWCYERI